MYSDFDIQTNHAYITYVRQAIKRTELNIVKNVAQTQFQLYIIRRTQLKHNYQNTYRLAKSVNTNPAKVWALTKLMLSFSAKLIFTKLVPTP